MVHHNVTIYTDGACRGNPGSGGWGAVVHLDSKPESGVYLFGGSNETTNDKMQLEAAIQSLNHLKNACKVALYTDSEYLKEGIDQNMETWKEIGWKTSNNEPIKNTDRWLKLIEAMSRHRVTLIWAKGHNKKPGIEKADQLANKGADCAASCGDIVEKHIKGYHNNNDYGFQ